MAELDTVARPYAKAAFASASDAGALPAWSALLRAAAIGAGEPAFARLVGNPNVPPAELAAVLADVARADAHGRAFLQLLAERRRLPALPAIAAQFEALRAAAEGRVDVELVSAAELSDEQERRFAAALKQRLGREVVIQARVDAALLGGAIVRAGDLVIDGSVRGRLRKLAAALGQ